VKLAVTGGTGLVGRFVVEAALTAGHAVTVLGRKPPDRGAFSAAVDFRRWSLGDVVPDLRGQDGLVHAAFDHLPGRYRGGEGDDPAGFRQRNLDGTRALFEATPGRVVFLSSRAVYGDWPPGTALDEAMEPRPDTLYGGVKLAAEQALTVRGNGVSLRATGVYGPAGPGQRHKWADLFDDFLAGRPLPSRVATEVHGADLAQAVLLALARSEVSGPLNVSDLVLDRHDLLAEVAARTGCPHAPPARSYAAVNVMTTARLRAMGWKPSGMVGLRAALPAMIRRT